MSSSGDLCPTPLQLSARLDTLSVAKQFLLAQSLPHFLFLPDPEEFPSSSVSPSLLFITSRQLGCLAIVPVL